MQRWQVAEKLGPYRRMASTGRPLPLLMVCETELGEENFRAAAGALPMLTATLERALAGPVTGAVTVWSRNGVPAALHCRTRPAPGVAAFQGCKTSRLAALPAAPPRGIR